MAEGYPKDWQNYIEIVEGNVGRLAKLESAIEQNHNLVLSFKDDIEGMRIQIKEMHDIIYKNGLSSKVDALWDKKEAINKIDTIWDRIKILDRITVGVITALLTAIVLYFFAGPDSKVANHQIIENLQKIEKKLDAIDKD